MKSNLPNQLKVLSSAICLAALVFATGCAKSIRGLPVYYGVTPAPNSTNTPATSLQVQYLRTGGFLFRHGTNTIITAPFYSNPSLLRVLAGNIATDHTRINDNMPPVHDAKAILVGHAHYDHAMDVPYIANYKATNALVYGGITVNNILLADISPDRLRSIEDCAGDFFNGGTAGIWTNIPHTTVRFMPLRSEHAPHFLGLKGMTGEVATAQDSLPERNWCWKEGQTLAYLIDFLAPDGTTVEHRVLYQDSAAGFPEFGGIPNLPSCDTNKVDILITCLANYDNVDYYPKGVYKTTRPENVIVGHWEDFFSDPAKLKRVRATNAKNFMKEMSEYHSPDKTFLPAPKAWMVFPKTN